MRVRRVSVGGTPCIEDTGVWATRGLMINARAHRLAARVTGRTDGNFAYVDDSVPS